MALGGLGAVAAVSDEQPQEQVGTFDASVIPDPSVGAPIGAMSAEELDSSVPTSSVFGPSAGGLDDGTIQPFYLVMIILIQPWLRTARHCGMMP